MKYFEVKREVLRGGLCSGGVYADGEFYEEADEIEIREITTGFSVFEYGENGAIDTVEFYPVHTDTESMEDDADEVLEKIKQDYNPSEWQNNNW